jgi:CubicO group peptidase (beta-lactamase class C family)
VDASIAPSVRGGPGVKYAYKWWLFEYGTESRLAFSGLGFGGQRLIVIPELDLVMALTGWKILPDTPNLTPRVAIDRVLEAVLNKE